MANWPAKVQFDDGTILFCKYSATVDVCLSELSVSEEELSENWHKQDNDDIECEHNEEDVLIITPFDIWKAKACRKCNRLTDRLELPESY